MPKEYSIKSDDTPLLLLAKETIAMKKQALVFLGSKRSAEKAAEDLSKSLTSGNEQLSALSEDALSILTKPTSQCERLSRCLRKGVAFHHAGLAQKQKDMIEENFKKGLIRIICCTPTLAYGVDTPAYRSIIRDVRRYSRHGLTFIPVLDYLQMAGRAGRPNFDSVGEAILIAQTEPEKEELIDRYIKGVPEEIYSKLAVEPALRTYLLSLISSNFTNTRPAIMDFFSKTFYAHQFQDIQKISLIINRMLHLLEEWEFITISEEDFQSADIAMAGKIKATLLGKRVSELYIDPLTAHYFITCLQDASDRKLSALSFLHMICRSQEMRPLLRVKTKEFDALQKELLLHSSSLLEQEPSLYDPSFDEYLDSFKTSQMFCWWIDEKSEEELLERFDARPGELFAKLSIADWLLYSATEICSILHYQPLSKEISKLRVRLTYGVREELLSLLKLEGIGRVRARALFSNKIKDIADIKNADISTLKQILGEKLAHSVKSQVGEEVSPVSEGKRKGQMSLKKYE